jgi:hypothetical protein
MCQLLRIYCNINVTLELRPRFQRRRCETGGTRRRLPADPALWFRPVAVSSVHVRKRCAVLCARLKLMLNSLLR